MKIDLSHIWHPFTQEKTAPPPIVISRGEGSFLFDDQGNKYIDAISSWWVNLHGHGNKKIAEAIFRQAQELEQVIFAGFTHKPAALLCEKLQKLLPPELTHFFFSDNGSTAVEVALKMAYQYFWNNGEKERNLFLSLEGAYHGDTFGAMSIGKASGFYRPFHQFLFEVKNIPYPATWINDDCRESKESQALDKAKNILDSHAPRIAAFICEPLVQGASGMRLVRPSFIRSLVDLIRPYGIPIIFDEVMTGFFRTGTLFALSQIQRTPDILCISKGLTGGFLPLSLTITTEKIYNAFLGDHFETAFLHGHSYTANPLGCAAALASLELLYEPETLENINRISQIHKERIMNFPQARCIGTIAAYTLPHIPINIKETVMQHGIIIRPLGNTLYILPPYCISSNDLHYVYDVLEKLYKCQAP